jgi:hypothetical protein
MIRISIGAAARGGMVLLAVRAESGVRSQTAAGEHRVRHAPAAGGATVVLRVQNDFPDRGEVYAERPTKTRTSCHGRGGTSQTVGIGTDFFRYALTTFEVRPVNDSASTLLGLLNLNKGDRVRIVVSAKLDSSHVYQNGNW